MVRGQFGAKHDLVRLIGPGQKISLKHDQLVQRAVRPGNAEENIPQRRDFIGGRGSKALDPLRFGFNVFLQISGSRLNCDAAPRSFLSWRLFDLFGAFPAVLDRHICEFFPQFFATGEYFGKKLGVDAYSLEATVAGS